MLLHRILGVLGLRKEVPDEAPTKKSSALHRLQRETVRTTIDAEKWRTALPQRPVR